MNASAQREPLPAVNIAGVVAIIFSAFGILGSLLVGLSLLLVPRLQSTPGMPPTPPEARAIGGVSMFFFLALSGFGIFVAVGIFRRRNWARIAILIWGGFMVFVGLLAIAASLLMFSVMQTQLPNANGVDGESVMRFVTVFVVVFYGVPAAVGIWWLVLFTRKRVADAFTNPPLTVALAPAMGASGFPQVPETAAAPVHKKPACPLPLAILAGFFIFSSFTTILFVVIPTSYSFPLFLFGYISSGVLPKIFLGLLAVVLAICGVAILKLKPWALDALLAVQSIFFINGSIGLFSPAYKAAMRKAVENMAARYPAFPGGTNPFLSDPYIWSMMLFGLAFAAVIIGLLVFFRPRFLEQAAAAAHA